MQPDELLPQEEPEMTASQKAFAHMQQAFGLLKEVESSRENALAITNLEQSMMWHNKDRTIKGEFEPYATHTT